MSFIAHLFGSPPRERTESISIPLDQDLGARRRKPHPTMVATELPVFDPKSLCGVTPALLDRYTDEPRVVTTFSLGECRTKTRAALRAAIEQSSAWDKSHKRASRLAM